MISVFVHRNGVTERADPIDAPGVVVLQRAVSRGEPADRLRVHRTLRPGRVDVNPYVDYDAVCWAVWERMRALNGDGVDVSDLLRVWEDRLVDVWRNELASW